MMEILLMAAAAGDARVPADLAAAVRAYDAAQVKGDRAALERWLADDYRLVNSRGVVETKADLIRDYTAPGFTLAPFTVEQPIEQVWGANGPFGGAVMGGVATLRGTDDGKPYSVRLRFADIWAKRGGRWQVIHTEARRAPE